MDEHAAIVRPVMVGGMVPVLSREQVATYEQAQKEAADLDDQPGIQGLAGHVKSCFMLARTARLLEVEPRMLSAIRRRRGEYDPAKLNEIKQAGGSVIFMMLTSNKCRAATSWLRDTYSGAGSDKPWSIDPTPSPDLSPAQMEEAFQEAQTTAQQYIMATGQVPSVGALRQLMLQIKDRVMSDTRTQAADAADRASVKMEDLLAEGGFRKAMAEFIDDLTTFPAAVMKGPVVRRKPRLTWAQKGAEWAPTVETVLTKEWERVDPFRCYPAPRASNVEDSYFIEHHSLTRRALTEMIGVEGYSEAMIREVLDQYGKGGLRDWLTADSVRAAAEGRMNPSMAASNQGDTRIDALQFWGSVSGKMLREWGMAEAQIPDEAREYDCEVWVVGPHVIRAVLNPDPLGRKPYFKTSYEEVPGLFWGNSVVDLVADCQDACNAAARALMNNMGLGSGPQVAVNVQRLPAGAGLTGMHPWKVWQFESDPYGSTAPAIDFFQPDTHAQELMAVYEKFSILADEYSGIPRYMTGDASAGGAGRTASGMSMLMSNAGKTIKQVIANIDVYVLEPMLERLYYLLLLDPEVDPELKRGDLRTVASGARALVAKEQAQLRRNEFLQIALNSPMAQQVVGMDGIATLLRETAKGLDMPVDRIVPPLETLRQRWLAEQQAQQQQAMAQQGPAPGAGQALEDGRPVTDNFAPLTG